MKTIAIDFDGTLCTAQHPLIGAPQPGAARVLKKLYDAGHYIIIWTCRQGADLEAARQWLDDNGFCYHAINENNPAHVKQYGGDTRKVNADVYIDDRQLGGLPSWPEIEKILWAHIRETTDFPRLLNAVCHKFEITKEDLLSRSRIDPLPTARQSLAALLYLADASPSEIARYMNFSLAASHYWINAGHDRLYCDRKFREKIADLLPN